MKETPHPAADSDRRPLSQAHRSWGEDEGGTSWRFLGKGPERGLVRIAAEVLPEGVRLAWLRQIHSAEVWEARPSFCGEGDALWSTRRGLALAVVTADCVPVLLAGEGWVAAVHAGWRGIAEGVVGATLRRSPVPPSGLRARIGPAIGCCCYEVGEEVARRIVEASALEVARPGPRGRPHLDLAAAVGAQLRAAGVRDIRTVERCTRCHPDELYSYRRDGRKAGRNVALIWLRY